MKQSRSRFREAMVMAFSKRDKVGWLAKGVLSGERSAISLKTGSKRKAS